MTAPTPATPKTKPENLFLNLTCNVAVPTLVLSFASGPRLLGPKWGLLVALLFPLGYGIHDYLRRRRLNFISAIGLVSVLISGGFGLLKLDGFWFAVKDAAIPALIGLGLLASMRTKEPLVREMLYNPQVIDVEKIDAILAVRNAQGDFQRLLSSANRLLALAMFVSAFINFFLARYLLRSPPGTEAFNAELGKMHWIGPLVLAVTGMPMMMYALWRLFKGLETLCGLTFDELVAQPPAQKKAAPAEGAAEDRPRGGA